MRNLILLAPTLALFLSACQSNSTNTNTSLNKTSIRSNSLYPGVTVSTYLTTINGTTTIKTPGLPDQVTTTPAGLTAAYQFDSLGVQRKMRVNAPAALFPDQRARIILYNQVDRTATAVFADTNQPDPNISTTDLATFLNTLVDAAASITSSGIAAMSQTKGLHAQHATPNTVITVNGVSTPVVQSSTDAATPGGQQQSIISVDPNIGMVVQNISTISNAEATQTNTSNYTYQSIGDVQVPATIQSTATLTAKATGDQSTATQNITFTDGQMNTVDSSYFTVGGL